MEESKGLILVLDDEEMIRDVLRQMLEVLGYEADFAADGGTAVKLYRQARASERPYNGVILDLTLPGAEGGQEVLKQLKEIDPHVRAIACSGYLEDSILTQYRQHGFSGAIAKPFRVENLKETLEEALRAGPGSN